VFPETQETVASEPTLVTTEPVTIATEPVVTFSMNNVDFGSIGVYETSNPIELVLTNTGSAPINISGVSITSDYLEANNCSNNVPVNESCIFDIQFSPTTTGEISGALTITSDAVNSPETVMLAGNGIVVDESGASSSDSPILIDTTVPEIQFYQDFNDLGVQTVLSDQQIKDNFYPITSSVTNNASPAGVTVVTDPAISGRGNSLRVFFPEGEYANGASGAAWQTAIPPGDEYYFAYDIYIPVGFNWPLGSKLPGLFGGSLSAASGKKTPNGVDGFAVRQTVFSERQDGDTAGYSNIGNGVLAANTYTYDRATALRIYNPNLSNSFDGAAKLSPGRWVSIEQRVVLNDATDVTGIGVKANGVYEAWVDGVQVFSETNWVYRQNTSLQIDHINFIWYYGGGSDDWGAREDQHMYFDNFVVSTQPITH
jgi:hypothetical protein